MYYPFHKKESVHTYIILKRGIVMAYNKKNQADYNKKCEQFKVQYRLTDIADGKRLKVYLAQTGQSANSYIKGLIKRDLDNKSIPYPDSQDEV